MKAYRTIKYVVYQPEYDYNIHKYISTDTLKKAKRIARKLGIGAEIHCNVEYRCSNGSGGFYTSHTIEYRGGYFVRFTNKTTVRKGEVVWKFNIGTKLK